MLLWNSAKFDKTTSDGCHHLLVRTYGQAFKSGSTGESLHHLYYSIC